jgi:hypothetical protein
MQVQAHFPHQPLPDFRLHRLAVQAFVLDSRQPCNLKAVLSTDQESLFNLAPWWRCLFTCHDFAWTFSRTRVGMSPLAANRQTAAMPQTTIAAKVHQTLNRLLDVAPQVTFDFTVAVKHLANPDLLVGSQFIAVAAKLNPSLFQHLMRSGAPNPVDTGERDFHPLVSR